jgi:hypothetical protein
MLKWLAALVAAGCVGFNTGLGRMLSPHLRPSHRSDAGQFTFSISGNGQLLSK